MAPAVEVRGLAFRYRGAATWALRGVDLTVEEGEAVLLTGPTGSGKSTLLRALNGLIPHFHEGEFRGRVVVLGTDTRATRPNRLGTRVGTVYQFPEEQILASRVWRDVAFGLENLLLPPEEIRARVEEALDRFGLLPLRDREVTALSGGEKQRLALAGVLAMEPSLLLLDEPAAELDPQARAAFVDRLPQIAQEGRSVVVADHRIEDLVPWVDRMVVLREGRVALEGPPEDVLRHEDLAAWGVEVPAAVRVWRRLDGHRRGSCPLTVEALADALARGRGTPGR